MSQPNQADNSSTYHYLAKFTLPAPFYLYSTHYTDTDTIQFILITEQWIYHSNTVEINELQPNTSITNLTHGIYTSYIINAVRTYDITQNIYKYVYKQINDTHSELQLYKITDTGNIKIPICFAVIKLYKSDQSYNLNTLYNITDWTQSIQYNINTTKLTIQQQIQQLQRLNTLQQSEYCNIDIVKQNTLEHCVELINKHKLDIQRLQAEKNRLIEQREKLNNSTDIDTVINDDDNKSVERTHSNTSTMPKLEPFTQASRSKR